VAALVAQGPPNEGMHPTAQKDKRRGDPQVVRLRIDDYSRNDHIAVVKSPSHQQFDNGARPLRVTGHLEKGRRLLPCRMLVRASV